MNWHMFSAMIALFAIAAAGLGLYVRLSIRSALGEFKAELLETLNGRYLSRREAEVRFSEIERRLVAREKR